MQAALLWGFAPGWRTKEAALALTAYKSPVMGFRPWLTCDCLVQIRTGICAYWLGDFSARDHYDLSYNKRVVEQASRAGWLCLLSAPLGSTASLFAGVDLLADLFVL